MTLARIETCPCGAIEEVETKAYKAGYELCWFIRCAKCGRETAKHTTQQGAVREWNITARETGK